MSNHPGVRCDRCSTCALLRSDGALPEGWAYVRVQRLIPFLDTGHKDICEVCLSIILDAIVPPEPTTKPTQCSHCGEYLKDDGSCSNPGC